MDTPPPVPPSLPPELPPPLFGQRFLLTLLGPLVTLALGLFLGHNMNYYNAEAPTMILIFGSLAAMFVCSILCALQLGKARGVAWGIVGFLIIQVFYITVSAIGCTASL